MTSSKSTNYKNIIEFSKGMLDVRLF